MLLVPDGNELSWVMRLDSQKLSLIASGVWMVESFEVGAKAELCQPLRAVYEKVVMLSSTTLDKSAEKFFTF